ncbi:MAG: putative endonuclease [Pseudohongiellaceae bacterium]
MAEKLTLTPPASDEPALWFVYIIRCGDSSLYTGITVDVKRRLKEHSGESGVNKGAKSLRGKLPLSLVFSTPLNCRSAALKLEYKIKQLSKAKKEELVCGGLTLADAF